MSARLRINPIACTAHGLCAELLPEMITLDEWGYPIVAQEPVPPQLLAHARRAVIACPTLALMLQEGALAGERLRPNEARAPGSGRDGQ
jgi:ferredoxin